MLGPPERRMTEIITNHENHEKPMKINENHWFFEISIWDRLECSTRQRLKSMRNDENSTKNIMQSAPQPQDTPSNVTEPSGIDWSGQTDPRAEISK